MLIRIVSVLCVVCARCGSTNKVAELSSFRSSQHSGSESMYALRRSVVVCVTACVLASMLVHV